MLRFLRRWASPTIININLPESVVMAAIDDLKAAATAIIANQAVLVKENADLKAQVADLTSQVEAGSGAASALATEDAAIADVAAQLNNAVQPAG